MQTEKQLISSKALFSVIEELLAEDRQAVFTVTGMSMWPFLCHGRDQVIVTRCRTDDLKTGTIVLFQTPSGKYILHRITRLRGEYFETTGDGNCRRDGWFHNSCIRAQVTALIRKEKKISCEDIKWKIIFRIWIVLFPIRRPLLRVLMTIGKLKGKLTGCSK